MTGETRAPKTFVESSKAVAKEFLQSVVVVDDQAAFDEPRDMPRGSSVDDAGEPADPPLAESADVAPRRRSRKPALRAPETIAAVPEQALNAKTLIDGFAEHGIVCAVIRPKPGETPIETTLKAAQRADIVVLDWELNKDDGETTLAIVKRLVHQEGGTKATSSLRLIAIYSGALSIHTLAQRLRKELRSPKKAHPIRSDGRFAIVAGPVRIAVFAKPTTRYGKHVGPLSELQQRIVSVSDLPDRLISEFSQLASGLVPHVALASLAALRKNTHKVLARLRSDLDSAYLWHRATQGRPADSEEHLVELVAAELHSVLEDEIVSKWADINAIREWLASQPSKDFAAAFAEPQPRTVADVEQLLTLGAAGTADSNRVVRDKFRKMCAENRAHKKTDIAGFATDARSAVRANEQLAALLSLRTRYENPVPRLELGVIVSKGRGRSRSYWVCVQPICDSVRLAGEVAFPFLPLKPPVEGAKFDLLVPTGKGELRRFKIDKRPSSLLLPVFAVNPGGTDSVSGTVRKGEFVFPARDGRVFRWVAELKRDHAQRVAQLIGNDFSRVGLTESEWLRLWATKS